MYDNVNKAHDACKMKNSLSLSSCCGCSSVLKTFVSKEMLQVGFSSQITAIMVPLATFFGRKYF